MSGQDASSASSISVTIKADTRSLRRGLMQSELAMRPRLLRRLRLRWQLWKINREPAS